MRASGSAGSSETKVIHRLLKMLSTSHITIEAFVVDSLLLKKSLQDNPH